jgi:hypothetical protein
MSASLNVRAPGFDDGSRPDDPLNVIVEITGFQNSILPSKPTRSDEIFRWQCLLSGVLRLGKRMKFGGLGWPPR